MSTITIRLPKGVSEEEIRAVIERYVKARLRSTMALDKLLARKGLDEEELIEFERFRDEFWKEKKREFSL